MLYPPLLTQLPRRSTYHGHNGPDSFEVAASLRIEGPVGVQTQSCIERQLSNGLWLCGRSVWKPMAATIFYFSLIKEQKHRSNATS
jgi:hypothetical protein